MKLVHSVGNFVCKCFSLIAKGLFYLSSLACFGLWLAAIIRFITDGIGDLPEILGFFIGGAVAMLAAWGFESLGEKLEDMVDDYKWQDDYSTSRSSTSYSGSYSTSSSFNASEYVSNHCKSYIHGVVSDADISRIQQDTSLTPSQKEAAVEELKHKSALYY